MTNKNIIKLIKVAAKLAQQGVDVSDLLIKYAEDNESAPKTDTCINCGKEFETSPHGYSPWCYDCEGSDRVRILKHIMTNHF
jgi:hypothetical protein